jgi:hypothetical protein
MGEGVIETFFLDWPFCFAAGLLFSMAGRREIARASSPYNTKAFRIGFAYTQGGLLGIGIAFYVLRPDWMWMYWADSARIPIVVVALAFALYEISFVAGFALGPLLAARPRLAIATVAIIAVGFSAAEYATRARLLHLGTLRAFEAGARPQIDFSPFHASGLGWLVLVIVPLSAVALITLVVSVERAGVDPRG